MAKMYRLQRFNSHILRHILNQRPDVPVLSTFLQSPWRISVKQ